MTEQNLLQAISEAIMGRDLTVEFFQADGHYGTADRSIKIDFAEARLGVLIGKRGKNRLAMKSLLAAPHDPDNCDLMFDAYDEGSAVRIKQQGQRPDPTRILKILEELQAYHGKQWIREVKVETSESAVVAFIRCKDMMNRTLRQPMSQLIREIGFIAGFTATLSIETTD